MLKWFLRFSEFAEFNESSAAFKESHTELDLPTKLLLLPFLHEQLRN